MAWHHPIVFYLYLTLTVCLIVKLLTKHQAYTCCCTEFEPIFNLLAELFTWFWLVIVVKCKYSVFLAWHFIVSHMYCIYLFYLSCMTCHRQNNYFQNILQASVHKIIWKLVGHLSLWVHSCTCSWKFCLEYHWVQEYQWF